MSVWFSEKKDRKVLRVITEKQWQINCHAIQLLQSSQKNDAIDFLHLHFTVPDKLFCFVLFNVISVVNPYQTFNIFCSGSGAPEIQ